MSGAFNFNKYSSAACCAAFLKRISRCFGSWHLQFLVMILVLLCGLSAAGVSVAQADVLADARQQMQAGNDVQAVVLLEAWTRNHNSDYEAYFLLGMAYTQQGKYTRAIEMFHQVSALRPELAEPHGNLAVIYNELGEPEAAARELEKFIKIKPDDPVTHENLGDIHVKLALLNYQAALVRQNNPTLLKKYQQLSQVGKPENASGVSVNPPIEYQNGDHPANRKTGTTESANGFSDHVSGENRIHKKADNAWQSLPVEQQVVNAVEQWRSAWTGQDLHAYFDSYSMSFTPDAGVLTGKSGLSLAAWKTYKTRVIAAKDYIHITLNNMRIKVLDGGMRAQVNFLQFFDSNSYASQDKKELTLKKEGQGWKIIGERVL